MHTSRPLFLSLAICGLTLGSVPPLWADGCMLNRRGTYVPEKEQQAYIEWDAGRERLYVATRVEASEGPALWVLPIPSAPEQVVVEPVHVFPHVNYTVPFVKVPREQLTKAAELTLFLDTALLCPLYLGRYLVGVEARVTFQSVSMQVGSTGGDGVTVHQRLEKLGLAVEVLSARDLEAFDRYLHGKGIGVRAKEITALEPYFAPEYVFICAWPADPTQAHLAQALRIDFASPRIFFPMRASRVYSADIETSVFVRGWARPAPGPNVPGLRCRYVRAAAAASSSADPRMLVGGGLPDGLSREKWGQVEPHTRVELPRSPREWTEDLHLEPEGPAAIRVAGAVERLGPVGLWLAGGLQGVLFLGWLPLALFPRNERRWSDWTWAGMTGLALTLSLIAAALMFGAWMRSRDPKRNPLFSPTADAVLALAILLVAALAIIVRLSNADPAQFWDFASSFLRNRPGPAGLFLTAVTFVTLLGFAARGVWNTERKGVVFLGFALLHLSANLVVLIGLERWLAQYA